MEIPKAWTHTSNGVEIVAGLKVFTYDWKWGTVGESDFKRTMDWNASLVERGYELTTNDFWFRVRYPDGSANIYNGERMTTLCGNCHKGYEDCEYNK